MMKRLILPLILILLGAGLLVFSFVGNKATNGDLDIEIVKTETIMPAAHNVYANKNALDGKYYLFKAKLTNNTNQTLKDIKVKYRVPNFIEWTDLDEIGEMFPGQTATVICYPKFPESITEKTTSSVEKVEIAVDWDGAKEDDTIEENFDFNMTGRKEFKFTNLAADEIAGWGDVFDNADLLPCFVTPNDPIVQYYTQNIQEKILKGENTVVSKKPEEAVRFLAGIYNSTILSHMVYSGTKGIPQSLTDVSQFSQENRLPREVITGNTGLCLELSLLYASIMSNAGLDPIIYMAPGHAYPGFVMNGQYYAIEATGIGGEGLGGIATAEQAFQAGQKQLEEFFKKAQMGDPQYQIINIHELNQQGATPMALKDDQFLRQKVENIAAKWSAMTSAPAIQNRPANRPSSQPVPAPSPNPVPVSPAPTPASNYNVAIPSNWQTLRNPLPGLNILSAKAMSPDQLATISIFDVPTPNTERAMQQIAYELQAYDNEVNFEVQGNEIQGVTLNVATGASLVWMGKAIRKGNSTRIVAVGSIDYAVQDYATTLNQIFNSIR